MPAPSSGNGCGQGGSSKILHGASSNTSNSKPATCDRDIAGNASPERAVDLATVTSPATQGHRGAAVANDTDDDFITGLPAGKVLLLCCGDDQAEHSLFKHFTKLGAVCDGYDKANGPQSDPADTYVFDRMHRDVLAGDYAAAYACPDTTILAKLRAVPGPKRYSNLAELSQADRDQVKLCEIISNRTAVILSELTRLKLPWICQTTATAAKQASFTALEKVKLLLGHRSVKHTRGVQCPFGALSASPMILIYNMVDLGDMPTDCRHELRTWFSGKDGTATMATHQPLAKNDTFTTKQSTPSQPGRRNYGSWEPVVRYFPDRNDRPDTLNRYMALKLHVAVLKAIPLLVSASGKDPNESVQLRKAPKVRKMSSDDTFKVARYSFSERITWLEPRLGYVPPTDKEVEDNLAIGGLRNAPASVARLHTVAAFGRTLGDALMGIIMENEHRHQAAGTEQNSWIARTCSAIGSDDAAAEPPADAVSAVKAMLIEMTGMAAQDSAAPRRTKVDAPLLEAWRIASGDPDDHAGKWMLVGAPSGIEVPVIDPGIFPPCYKPAELEPQDVFTKNHGGFRNYQGVEEQQITDDELAAHLEKDHIAAFDTLEELEQFVGGDVALNKLGLIIKTRAGVTKARMILDTKQSKVKHASTQGQRVTLPRPFDAILHLLFLMTVSMACVGGADALISFVLDFSDAFWQVPLLQQEFKYYCATGLIHGVRKWIAFLRAPQGSSAAPTLWGRVDALFGYDATCRSRRRCGVEHLSISSVCL